MKRPAGLILFAALLFILGLQLLSGRSVSDSGTGVIALRFLMGMVSLAAASALWTRRADALGVYWAWAAVWLLAGGMTQYLYQDVPLLHIGIWWAFIGAVLGFVGLYLRGVVKRTA